MTKPTWTVEMELAILNLLDERGTLHTDDIVIVAGASEKVVGKCLIALRRAGLVANVGREKPDPARWCLRPAVDNP